MEHLCSNWNMTRPVASHLSPAQGRSEPARDVILRAAAALVATNPGASLSEIARAAGVGRTTVHRAFPTRESLLTALALQAVDQLRAALAAARLGDGTAIEALERVVHEVLPLADEFRFLDGGPELWDLPQLKDAWWSVTVEFDSLVQRGQREGDIRGDVPAEVIVEAFTGMLWGVWQGVRDGRVAPATAGRHIVTLSIAGITPVGRAVRS
jgi:AcrR family transcriptional regulator